MSTTLTAAAAAELADGLALIRREAGLDQDTPPILMRYTINAVYRIGETVVRLAHGPAGKDRAARAISVTELFACNGVPSVELVAGLSQPVVSGEWVATVWKYLPHPAGRPHAIELAGPLRRVHAITETPPDLPRWSPIATARRRLAAAHALPPGAQQLTRAWCEHELELSLEDLTGQLADRCDALELQVSRTAWELSQGVIHGDAHVGNLLGGRLCDFDSAAIGPREWDLVPLAHSAARFGDPTAPYGEFAAAYGFDLLASPAWPVLRDVRELQLVTSVLDKLDGRPDVASNLAARLRTYLSDDLGAVWERYQ